MPMEIKSVFFEADKKQDSKALTDSTLYKEYERIRNQQETKLPDLEQLAINKDFLLEACESYKDKIADSMTIAEVAIDYAILVVVTRRVDELRFWKTLLQTPRPTQYTAEREPMVITVDDCFDILDCYQVAVKLFAGKTIDNRESLLHRLREILVECFQLLEMRAA